MVGDDGDDDERHAIYLVATGKKGTHTHSIMIPPKQTRLVATETVYAFGRIICLLACGAVQCREVNFPSFLLDAAAVAAVHAFVGHVMSCHVMWMR